MPAMRDRRLIEDVVVEGVLRRRLAFDNVCLLCRGLGLGQCSKHWLSPPPMSAATHDHHYGSPSSMPKLQKMKMH
jgi:hypothetical protein